MEADYQLRIAALVVATFLDRSELRITRSVKSWKVSVDGLPGTECSGDCLGEVIRDCVLAFVVKDWRPRGE